MPQVNLSALNGQELRQLLDSSRRRGDAALSYKVLQEMAARREAPAERRPAKGRAEKGRRAAEPRHIEADLDDPAEADDVPPMPNWRPPALRSLAPESGEAEAQDMEDEDMAAENHAAPPPLDAERPLTLRDNDPEPAWDAAAYAGGPGPRFQPVELEGPNTPKRPRFRLLAGLVLGAVLGIALGWLGGWLARDAITPRSAPTAAPIQTAALTPPPAAAPALQAVAPQAATGETPTPAPEAAASPEPLGPAAAEPTAAPDPALAQAPPDPAPAPIKPPKPARLAARAAPDPAPVPDGAALELPAPTAPAVAKGCARQPTPADRAICGDPDLRRLQAELRAAYTEALDAHQDRTLLRQRQLAWADARNAVTDPERLTRLYQERIRKLNAATAQARREQP